MFQDLDATLGALLDAPEAPPEVRAADISFDTPEQGFAPTQATLNLFLHDVQENRGLRRGGIMAEHANGIHTVRQPPLRVDCTYLVTAWSTRTGGLKAAEEHGLLGLTLLWLSGFLLIDDPYLRGSLSGAGKFVPLPAQVAQTREGQSMGEFWTALGIPPRPAFSLTVTVALRPFTPAQEYGDVKAVQLRPTLSDHPVLAGRVRDAGLAPVAGVTVALDGANRQTVTDEHGGFSFTGLAFGDYTVLVQRPGKPDVRLDATYEAGSQVHDVILPAA